MRIWVYTQDDKMIERHYFKLPEFGEPGFYRAVTSYEAQRNALMKREHNTPQGYRYSIDRAHEFLEKYADKTAKTHHHASIWDAYKAIGYDYKSRTFKVEK